MRSRSALLAPLLALLVGIGAPRAIATFEGIGRAATPAEIAAWDIDVRPDFAGLPPGSGSVADGEEIWTDRCTSCHGDFGTSNDVFQPLVGNTTEDDIATGRVAALRDPSRVRSTLAKVPTVSTLWDTIRRAMPWDDPKSLTDDEVYAVLAYLLNLGEIVDEDFVLSDETIAEVQARMPNRNGMTREHGLWDVDGKPDVTGKACMKDCRGEARIVSAIPASARSLNGDLAKQHRPFGPVRGVSTPDPNASPDDEDELELDGEAIAEVDVFAIDEGSGFTAHRAVGELLEASGCRKCHGLDRDGLGPSFTAIAGRHAGKPNAAETLTAAIRAGSEGSWGTSSMPPQTKISDENLDTIVTWIVAGANP